MCTQVITAMKKYAYENHVPIIRDDAAQVLMQAVDAAKPQHILEIGTAIGYSTLLIAERMPADAVITTIELDDGRYKTAQAFLLEAAYRERIKMIHADAAEALIQLEGKFDFVFIDAAKGQYLKYFHLLKGKLAPQAVIIADNVLFRGYVRTSGEVPRRYRTIVRRLREYLEAINQPPHFITEVYETDDGISVTYYQGENNGES